MNVLIVFAHPEPQSLSGSFLRTAVATLKKAGHDVSVSDLYAQNWKAVLDRRDYGLAEDQRLFPLKESRKRLREGRVCADIVAEQEKVLRADAVIFQFPLWWFGMPAILKGWFDRVYSQDFGYGLGSYTATSWGDRYGEGRLAGKRAMLSVTIGGWPDHYSDRGINGPAEAVLYPINHGLLFYAGFDTLEPFLVFQSDRMTEERYRTEEARLVSRLEALFTERPIAYRRQNGGDYEIPSLRLRDGVEGSSTGPHFFDLHKNR